MWDSLLQIAQDVPPPEKTHVVWSAISSILTLMLLLFGNFIKWTGSRAGSLVMSALGQGWAKVKPAPFKPSEYCQEILDCINGSHVDVVGTALKGPGIHIPSIHAHYMDMCVWSNSAEQVQGAHEGNLAQHLSQQERKLVLSAARLRHEEVSKSNMETSKALIAEDLRKRRLAQKATLPLSVPPPPKQVGYPKNKLAGA